MFELTKEKIEMALTNFKGLNNIEDKVVKTFIEDVLREDDIGFSSDIILGSFSGYLWQIIVDGKASEHIAEQSTNKFLEKTAEDIKEKCFDYLNNSDITLN